MLAHCKLVDVFCFVLAKPLPERHNLYGNSLDFKLNIYKKKMILVDKNDYITFRLYVAGLCDLS